MKSLFKSIPTIQLVQKHITYKNLWVFVLKWNFKLLGFYRRNVVHPKIVCMTAGPWSYFLYKGQILLCFEGKISLMPMDILSRYFCRAQVLKIPGLLPIYGAQAWGLLEYTSLNMLMDPPILLSWKGWSVWLCHDHKFTTSFFFWLIELFLRQLGRSFHTNLPSFEFFLFPVVGSMKSRDLNLEKRSQSSAIFIF